MKKFLFSLLLCLCVINLSSCRPSANKGTRVVNGNTSQQSQPSSSNNKYKPVRTLKLSNRTIEEFTVIDGNGCTRKFWQMHGDAFVQEHMPNCTNPNCPYKQHKTE